MASTDAFARYTFKHLLFFVSFLIINQNLFPQLAPSIYLVEFTDKEGSAFNVQDPLAFLSDRALDRRKKQDIPISINDLPVNSNYISDVLELGNFSLGSRSKWLNAITIVADDTSGFSNISSLPFVKRLNVNNSASRSMKKSESEEKTKIDEIDESLNYGLALKQTEMININRLHELGFTGEGIHIALFDAGYASVNTMSAFQHVIEEGRLLGKKDFVTEGLEKIYSSTHGRYVLSAMAGYIPGVYVGTAPDASYWLFRTEDTSSEYEIEEFNWLVAAEYADSVGVDIINSSLSYKFFDDSLQNHSYEDLDGNTAIVTKAADCAASKGIIVVCSAGNSGSSSSSYVGAPADADSVLTIGAVTSTRAKASFSSYGLTIDGRIKPSIAAQGQSTRLIEFDGSTIVANGTSFASPIIAGATACLWQAFPTDRNMEIIQEVEQSSDQYNHPDTLLGNGIPDFLRAYQSRKARPIPFKSDYFLVSPNPIKDRLQIDYFSQNEREITISLYTIHGRFLYSNGLKVNQGRNYIIPNVNWDDYAKGIYHLTIESDDTLLSKKVIKL